MRKLVVIAFDLKFYNRLGEQRNQSKSVVKCIDAKNIVKIINAALLIVFGNKHDM